MERLVVAQFFQASGLRPRRNVKQCPCRSARGSFQGCGPRTAAVRQRGIVSDWLVEGKRKVCESMHRRSHSLHNFSTSTKTVQRLASMSAMTRFCWRNSQLTNNDCVRDSREPEKVSNLAVEKNVSRCVHRTRSISRHLRCLLDDQGAAGRNSLLGF